MHAIVHDVYGPPEVLRIEERPSPRPRSDELLVEVRATSVTTAESRFRSATFPPGLSPAPAPRSGAVCVRGGRAVGAVAVGLDVVGSRNPARFRRATVPLGPCLRLRALRTQGARRRGGRQSASAGGRRAGRPRRSDPPRGGGAIFVHVGGAGPPLRGCATPSWSGDPGLRSTTDARKRPCPTTPPSTDSTAFAFLREPPTYFS